MTSPSDPTPTTEAGRRLDQWYLLDVDDDVEAGWPDIILAIEAEARAEALNDHGDGDGCACYNRGYDHGLSAGER